MSVVLTHELVREILDYDTMTGHFTWKKKISSKTVVGSRAGGEARPNDYRYVTLLKKRVLEHRLAWFWVHGVWPPEFIDHKNLNKTDNRIDNLRLASVVENACNAGAHRDNRSGTKGIWQKPDGSWCGLITFNKKRHYLGVFAHKTEAAAAYRVAANRLHGKFARAQ
jgi:hypothetical protein